MQTYFLVALGGALGSMARFWFSRLVSQSWGGTLPWLGEIFPLGTLVVNITGSFVIGLFATATGPDGRFMAGSDTRYFLMTGFCGGYTTFSAFSLETLNLMRGGEWLRAGANCVASLVLCLIAVWLGHTVAMALNSTKGS